MKKNRVSFLLAFFLLVNIRKKVLAPSSRGKDMRFSSSKHGFDSRRGHFSIRFE